MKRLIMLSTLTLSMLFNNVVTACSCVPGTHCSAHKKILGDKNDALNAKVTATPPTYINVMENTIVALAMVVQHAGNPS